MLAMGRDGAPEGTWLRAENQTGGKGRSGRQWISPPGNLYATTLVRLQPSDPSAPSLALVAAIALHEIASAYAQGRALTIKWPNDLLHDGAKLAGILLEREGDNVVVGIGVNLAHHPDLQDRPTTSVASFTDAEPDPAGFLTDLAQSFERWLGIWRGAGLSAIRAEWLGRAHPIGTALSAALPQEQFDGLFDGLDETGALCLRLADGSVRVIQAGDVFLL